MHKEAVAAGFTFEPSRTKTYWSNQDTMKTFVDNILAPYFEDVNCEYDKSTTEKNIDDGLPLLRDASVGWIWRE